MPEPLTLAMMEGDGIGPEITAATREVIAAADTAFRLGLAFIDIQVGFVTLERSGSTLPDEAFETAAKCDGIVLGPVSHNAYPPRDQGGLNPSGELRRRLDLYANLRPAITRAGIAPRAGIPLDLLIVRENTEGFYSDRNLHLGPGEIMPTPDIALSFRKVTRSASIRIAETAFAEATRRRGKVTAVHKGNVLRVSDGLFLDCVREVAERHSKITYEEQLIDAMCAHLVRRPDAFDVICTTNMYGDILSDLAAELAGGLGLAGSLNAGPDHAMAQAQHGSAPDIAGQGLANPTSLILSGAMLLRWLGARHGREDLTRAGDAVEAAVDHVLSEARNRTPDLGGSTSTEAFGALVAEAVARQ
ncbi:MAG: isocitrate/isopropylmalate dehydrogenase family protein [Pseudomonadota bacterium]